MAEGGANQPRQGVIVEERIEYRRRMMNVAEGGENQPRQRFVVEEGNDYRERLINLVEAFGRDIDIQRNAMFNRPDFSRWIKQRRETLKELKDLRIKLDNISVRTSYAQGTGNVTGMAGSVTTIIGSLMALFGSSSGPVLTNVGKLMNSSGNMTNSFSRAARGIFSAGYLDGIGSVLEKDRELSEPVIHWLTTTRNLDANVQRVFGCSLIHVNFLNVANAFNEFFNLYLQGNNFQSTLNMLSNERYSLLMGCDGKLRYVQRLCTELEENMPADFSNKLRNTLLVLSAGTGAYQFCVEFVQFYNRWWGNELPTAIPTLRGGLSPEIPTLGQVSQICIFQTIDIALNYLSLLSAYKVIKDGKSQYSDALIEIESLLHLELERIERL